MLYPCEPSGVYVCVAVAHPWFAKQMAILRVAPLHLFIPNLLPSNVCAQQPMGERREPPVCWSGVLDRRSLKIDPLGEVAAVSFPNAALEDPGTSQDVWLKRPRGEAVVIDDEVQTFWPLE